MLPGTIQLAVCVTDDEAAVAASLAGVVGLARPGPERGARVFSWAQGSRSLIGTILGAWSSGTIEIEPLPVELRARLVPGTTAISFAVDDLDERVEACRAAGLDVTVAVARPGGLDYAVVAVAGLEFELVATG